PVGVAHQRPGYSSAPTPTWVKSPSSSRTSATDGGSAHRGHGWHPSRDRQRPNGRAMWPAFERTLRTASTQGRPTSPSPLSRKTLPGRSSSIRSFTNQRIRPGTVVSIATTRILLQWHPHEHILVPDGAFSDDGEFHPSRPG